MGSTQWTKKEDVEIYFRPTRICHLCRRIAGDAIPELCAHIVICERCKGRSISCTECLEEVKEEQQARLKILKEILPSVLAALCLAYLPTRLRIVYTIHEISHDDHCSEGVGGWEIQNEIERVIPIPKELSIYNYDTDDDLLGEWVADFMASENERYQTCNGYCGMYSTKRVKKITLL